MPTLPFLLALALLVMLMVTLVRLHRVPEIHHGYFGAALVALTYAYAWPVAFAWIGVVLLVDDDVQHVAEALGIVPPMADFTPIHKLGALIVGFDWKRAGWWAPLGGVALLAAAAIFFALRGTP